MKTFQLLQCVISCFSFPACCRLCSPPLPAGQSRLTDRLVHTDSTSLQSGLLNAETKAASLTSGRRCPRRSREDPERGSRLESVAQHLTFPEATALGLDICTARVLMNLVQIFWRMQLLSTGCCLHRWHSSVDKFICFPL